MAYDLGVTRLAVFFGVMSFVCALRGMYIGNIPDLLGAIVFAMLANFLKWDDPDM